MNILEQETEYQPSYSYVNKKFHCYACNKEFRELIRSGEGATCTACNSEFVEEVTRENRDDIDHFEPYIIRPQQQRAQPMTQRRREQPSVIYITQTIGPRGIEFYRRGAPSQLRNNPEFVRTQPSSFINSLFGFPFSGFGSSRMMNLDDIIELSMRDAGNQGVPPASEATIKNLNEFDIKEGESHQ